MRYDRGDEVTGWSTKRKAHLYTPTIHFTCEAKDGSLVIYMGKYPPLPKKIYTKEFIEERRLNMRLRKIFRKKEYVNYDDLPEALKSQVEPFEEFLFP